jgi:hypothetical protein
MRHLVAAQRAHLGVESGTRSWPSSQISPVTLAWVPLCSPRIAWLVTDLPDPDSPTMPRVVPRSNVKLSPSTAWTSPSSVGNCTRRSRTSTNAVGGPPATGRSVESVSVPMRSLLGSGEAQCLSRTRGSTTA